MVCTEEIKVKTGDTQMIGEKYNGSIELRDKEQISSVFLNAENIVAKNYLKFLKGAEIVSLDRSIVNIDIEKFSRFYKINKLVYDKNENKLDKLSSVLNAVSFSSGNVAVIIDSNGSEINYYIGVVNKELEKDSTSPDLRSQKETLNGAFNGNFQGSNLSGLTNSEVGEIIEEVFEENSAKVITSVSGVAALNLEKEDKITGFIQGLEKLTDSMYGKKYSIVLIADVINEKSLEDIKMGYENLYSQLYPFLKTNVTLSKSKTLSKSEGIAKGFTESITESISKTQSQSESNGWNKSFTSSISKSRGAAISAGLATTGAALGTVIPVVGNVAGAIIGSAIGTAISGTLGTKIEGSTEGESYNSSFSTSRTSQFANNTGISNQESFTDTEGNTNGESLQITYKSKKIKYMLEKIEAQLKRIELCKSFGAFNTAAYIISNDTSVNNSVASVYNALMKGNGSAVESSMINTWNDKKDVDSIIRYLKKFTHPEFIFNDINVTAGSIVNSKELAIQLMLPKKSVQGIPVVECTSFGRNVIRVNENEESQEIKLGSIYHMGKEEETKVKLEKKSLAMHTFVTGSTGAGKSNAIYKILDELKREQINFLVVEPAKGEYKNVFGHRSDVEVYGTNPKKTKLLKINPFAFNEDTHILEHIDRIIEIFNVCWPMYAAMPAVLKEAVEEAYRSVGWDLDNSENENEIKYPSFEDVLEQLTRVINKSAFSDELKGNYVGSLVTRVKSLTNGINGLIFSNNGISDEELFDSNVIVDLSRIGSIETKSLIMGILILKLQEHRMSQGGMNVPLKHVTVLEEAHNILKRTSTEQSSEGSNMIGKSVEMLSNAIAEMRTFGEGFIIADQSPSMVDMAAIRNTNTKIVLRLPEESDRQVVGKAIGLSEEKISELAKLETGVAAIYQNDWIETVLGKIEKVDIDEEIFLEKDVSYGNAEKLKGEIAKILVKKHLGEKVDISVELLKEIKESNMRASLKGKVLILLDKNSNLTIEHIYDVIAAFNDKKDIFRYGENISDIEEWNKALIENVSKFINEVDEDNRKIVLQCLLREKLDRNEELNEFYGEWVNKFRG